MGVVPLWKYSVEAKMSWAANRKCGRAEDMAYSLLGIFDIHMPLVYGEGAKQAFQRLQLEIIKSTPDLSIFAWHIEQNKLGAQFCSLLSQSPSQFGFTRRICRSIPERHHTMTNKGIEMTSILYRVSIGQKERYFLCLEDKGETNKATGIFLRKIDYNMFQRAEGSLAEIQDLEICPSTHTSTFYISTSPRQHDPEVFSSHSGIIYVPQEYRVLDVVPEASWDCESRVLLGNMPCNDGVRALKLAVTIGEASMLVGLLFRSSNIAIVIEWFENTAISEKLFTRTNKRKLMNWGELLSKVPELCRFSDYVKMKNGSTLRIRVVPEARHPHQLLIELEKALKDLSLVPKSVKDAGSANNSKDTSQNIAQGFASMSETADGRWERLSASSEHTYGAQVGRYRKQDPILLPRAISDANSSMTRGITSRSTISGRRK
ncbi:hypothetical protein HD806DRAFT_76586 [Xylariaceae sp. AK1471]|nr:hypothetical protein HD806DRAFT_76586 [Xylariaceae sp. AK1471]